MKKYWIVVLASVLFITGIILNFTVDSMFSAGDYSFNYFAVGNFAAGIFAAGNFSIGVFSIGIFSIGIFSISIFNIGIYAVGFFVIARNKRLPKLFNNSVK